MMLILSLFGYESLFYLRLALLESIFYSYAACVGGVAEWLNAPVLKLYKNPSMHIHLRYFYSHVSHR
jgi:hypothetical protein